MNTKDCHLKEDQIISAILDKKDLSTEEQNHLSKCFICSMEKQELEKQLFILSHLAREFSPSPKRTLIPVILDAAKKPDRVRLWRPVFATAFIASLIILTIWWIGPVDRYYGYKVTQDIEMIQTDQNIAQEINKVEEQLLSDSYINSNDEFDSYADYEFLDFILPLEENQNQAQSKYNLWA